MEVEDYSGLLAPKQEEDVVNLLSGRPQTIEEPVLKKYEEKQRSSNGNWLFFISLFICVLVFIYATPLTNSISNPNSQLHGHITECTNQIEKVYAEKEQAVSRLSEVKREMEQLRTENEHLRAEIEMKKEQPDLDAERERIHVENAKIKAEGEQVMKSSNRTGKTAAMTFVWNVPAWILFIWVFSQRQHIDPATHDCIIVGIDFDKNWDGYKQLAEEFNCILHAVPVKKLDKHYGNYKHWHLNSKRFVFWKDWAEENWHKYQAIMITDGGDVVFNGNPFEIIPNDRKEYQYWFLEHPSYLYGNTSSSRGYMDWCFTEDEKKELWTSVSSCAGTILGTGYSIMKYLELQVQLHMNRGGRCTSQGGDQGLHNLILRKQYLNKRYGIIDQIMENKPDGVGTVLSMTLIPRGDYGPEDQMKWLNTQTVMHQFKWWRYIRDVIIYNNNYTRYQMGEIKLERGLDWSKTRGD